MIIQFVGENHLGAIKSMIIGASRLDAAVAFWGHGAVNQLGLADAPSGGTIVCNLFSPGCNPHEIEKLFQLNRFKLRNHDGLHGKVYLTDQLVCIGSSNASGAGLGFETSDNVTQREANVICSSQELLNDAANWLKGIVDESKEITQDMLSEAKRRYRPPLSVQVNELIDVPLSELRKNKIGVLLWSEETLKKRMTK